MALHTRLTCDPAELDAIYRFRFQIYYGELGAQLPEEAVRTKKLYCELDDAAYQYASFEDGQVVGCVRVVDLKDIQKDDALITKYRLKEVINRWGRNSITFPGRMAVSENLRSGSLAIRLMTLATDEARLRGIRLAFLDSTPHLLPFYEAVGFRRYAPAFSDPVFGFKQPLLFLLRDHFGLKTIGSPLARSLNPSDDDPEIRIWYAQHYGAYAATPTATLLPCGAFTDLVECIFGGTLSSIPFFRSLSRQEIDLVLKKSTLVCAQAGNVVIRSRLRDDYLGVVLSGQLESHHAGHHLNRLGPGDLCGETEFLTSRERIAEVVACEPTTLLILPTIYLAHLIGKDATIGRTLMRNLASWLAVQTTQRLDGLAGPIRHQSSEHSVGLTTRFASDRPIHIAPHEQQQTAL